MQAIVTYCNTHTDAQSFPQPVDNPLAALARVMQCITVYILYYSIASAKRERIATSLNIGYGNGYHFHARHMNVGINTVPVGLVLEF